MDNVDFPDKERGAPMVRGFVTIATGHERYYRMARNLLRSYRQNCSERVRFALIADRRNEYTEEFDDVVILEHPANNWMDKLELLCNCPYDENIFIDADCLVYRDINYLWTLFSGADSFSCFGKALPLDAEGGWFTAEAAQVYPIHFLTHLHGMLYFIRKDEMTERMHQVCQDIIANYHAVRYKSFNDRMADEPVFALAMAILNLKPIDRKPEYYCFVPYATDFSSDYLTRRVSFENPTDGRVSGCDIVHWGNRNTLKAQYRFDAHACNHLETASENSLSAWLLYRTKLLLFRFRLEDAWNWLYQWTKWFFERVRCKLTRK